MAAEGMEVCYTMSPSSRVQACGSGTGKSFKQLMLGQLDIHMQINELDPLHHIQKLTQHESYT